jgi:hypothetical protein
MRAHGFGEIVVLGTDIYEMFTTALRRLVESARLKLPFYEVAGTVNFTAECDRFSVRGCPKQKEFRKQDQIGILAQNILLCGKLRLELFRESLFRTRMHGAVKCRDGNCRGEGASASAHARLVVGHGGDSRRL